MARKPMVTRTITTTEVTCLCLDINKGEPFSNVFVLPRTYKDAKSMLKVISETFDNEEHKAVHVVASETKETLYGMSEEEFVKLATEMPARVQHAE